MTLKKSLIDFSDIRFDFKTLTGIVVLVAMWYDLKTDFEVHKEEHKLLEFRIKGLETSLATFRPMAIVPKHPKLEDEDK